MRLEVPFFATAMAISGCKQPPKTDPTEAEVIQLSPETQIIEVEVVRLAPQIQIAESKRAAIVQVVLASPQPDDLLTITPALPDGNVEHFVFEDWTTKPYETRPSIGSMKLSF